jgi:hypothetical protein
MSTSTVANASFWHSLRDLLIQTNAESRAVDRRPGPTRRDRLQRLYAPHTQDAAG